jgi:hypothetical protein
VLDKILSKLAGLSDTILRESEVIGSAAVPKALLFREQGPSVARFRQWHWAVKGTLDRAP